MQDEIWRELARAKYLEWELHAAARATRYQNAERKLRAACGVAGTATTSGGGIGGGGGADYMDLTMEDADPFEAAWRDAKGAGGSRSGSGASYTLVPIRPRRRCERRSLRTLLGASLRPPLAFNPRPRNLSTATDAFELHPDIRLYRAALKKKQTKKRTPNWRYR
jgi:hypothetical protein